MFSFSKLSNLTKSRIPSALRLLRASSWRRGKYHDQKSGSKSQSAFYGLGMLPLSINTEDQKQKATGNGNHTSTVNQPGLVIKNLVLRGGGPRGLAYVGALKELDTKHPEILRQIERVAGTSAGAITATLLAIGCTPTELEELLVTSLDKFKEFITDGDLNTQQLVLDLASAATSRSTIGQITRGFMALVSYPIEAYHLGMKVKNNGAISTGDKFLEWLEDIISTKIAKLEGGNKADYRHFTFGQLQALINADRLAGGKKGYKDLHVVCAMFKPDDEISESDNADKATTLGPKVYTTENKKMESLIISDTVRISMSIPWIFQRHSLYYRPDGVGSRQKFSSTHQRGVDGGTLGELSNYPIGLFEYNDFLSEPFADKKPDTTLENPETLGFTLIKESELGFFQSSKNIVDKLQNPSSQKIDFRPDLKNGKLTRHIVIQTKGVTLFDFSLPKEKADGLIKAGKAAVNEFFHNGNSMALMDYQKEFAEQRAIINEKIFGEYIKNTNFEDFLLNSFPQKENYMVPKEYNQLERHMQLNTNKPIYITGITGSGKSSLAQYATWRYLKTHFWSNWRAQQLEKKPIAWLFAVKTSADLKTYYSELAIKLGIKDLPPKESDQIGSRETQVEPLLKWKNWVKHTLNPVLANYPHCLFLFDLDQADAEARDFAKINELLPNRVHHSGTILVSTQDTAPVIPGEHVNLDNGLGPEQAALFFKGVDGDVIGLINKLYLLPLGLKTAADHIHTQRKNLPDYNCDNYSEDYDQCLKAYLALIQGDEKSAMAQQNVTSGSAKKILAQTVAIRTSLTKIVATHNGEANLLLYICARVGCKIDSVLLREIFNTCTKHKNVTPLQLTDAYIQAIDILQSYGVIRREDKHFFINPLTQAIAYQVCPSQSVHGSSNSSIASALTQRFNYLTNNDYKKDTQQLAANASHVEKFLSSTYQNWTPTANSLLMVKEIAELWCSLGRFYLLYNGEFIKAENYFRQAEKLLEKALPANIRQSYQSEESSILPALNENEETLLRLYGRECLYQIGNVISRNDSTSVLQSIDYLQKAYYLQWHLPQPEQVSIAYTLRSLARAQMKLARINKNSKALASCRKIMQKLNENIKIYPDQFLPKVRDDLLIDEGIIEKLHQDQLPHEKRDYSLAITILKLTKKKFAQDNGRLAMLSANIADAYLVQNNHLEAITNYYCTLKYASAISQEKVKQEHVWHARGNYYLAWMFSKQGYPALADFYIKQALPLQKRFYGENNSYVKQANELQLKISKQLANVACQTIFTTSVKAEDIHQALLNKVTDDSVLTTQDLQIAEGQLCYILAKKNKPSQSDTSSGSAGYGLNHVYTPRFFFLDKFKPCVNNSKIYKTQSMTLKT